MLIVYPVSLHEREQAKRLFKWIEETGAGKNHDALLLLGKPAAAARFEAEILPLMRRCFKSAIAWEIPIETGPQWNPKTSPDASGANNMFLWGSTYCDEVLHRRFLWHEMDAIPTRTTAYDEIEKEDAEAGKPFMGARENSTPPRLSGIAVYPTEMPSHSILARNAGQVAWDIAAAGEIMPRAHVTANIQNIHWLGNECKASEQWDGKAAIFHQCKCGCLYDRLRAVSPVVIPAQIQPGPPMQTALLPPRPETGLPPDLIGENGRPKSENHQETIRGLFEQNEGLQNRIIELERHLLEQSRALADLRQSAPKQRIVIPVAKVNPIKRRRRKEEKPDTRTDEQIQATKERMAKARAGKQLATK